METVITLKPSELKDDLMQMLKGIVKQKNISEISIRLSDKTPAKKLRNETQKETNERIEKAIREIESGKASLVSFTAEEFKEFSKSLMNK